ncbi:FecR family protein [Brevundimonas naejangsanensis]
MPAEVKTRTAADDQAANWIARLGTRTISLDTIQEFARWREDPANAEAYRRAEQLWSRTGDLAGDPDIQAALEQAQRRRPRRFGAKQIGTIGLTAALAATLAAGVFFWQGRDTYATRVGEQRVLQLADGSRVRLDTASKMRVRFTEGERRIELAEGQALFEVAHNPARPFVVSTSDASVTAVGTVFEVRRVGSETRVVLVSGAVDVVQAATKGAPQRLLPNQQTAIKAGKAKVSTVNADTATSWTTGELTFVDTPLAEAVAEVNRYLAAPIVLDAPAAANTPINGVFRSGDRTAFVSAAAHLFDLKAIREADGKVRLVSSRNNAQG